MLISELQELLEKAKGGYGDIEVMQYEAGDYHHIVNIHQFNYRGEMVVEFS